MVSRLNFGRWSCSFAFPHPSSVLEVLNHKDSILRANDWHTEHLMDSLHLQPSSSAFFNDLAGSWVLGYQRIVVFQKELCAHCKILTGVSVYLKSSASAI